MRSPLFARTACAAAMLAVLGCAPAPAYKDGVFEAKSPGPFTSEPYLGDAKIVVQAGKITRIDFHIFNVKYNAVFDEYFEDRYARNYVFLDLCRNEVKGQKAYSAKLLEKQGLSGVDAVSGATWSHELFRASVKAALAKARKTD